jgi:hypothetical protein
MPMFIKTGPAQPTDANAKELTGQLRNIKNTFDNNDGTVTIIGRLASGHIIRGTLDSLEDMEDGADYLLLGKWIEHERHGWQFLFTSFCRTVPEGPDALAGFFAKHCQGIGLATGQKLVEAYGPNAVRVLIESPERAVADGLLREAVAVAAGEALRDVADPGTLDVHLGLFRLFRQHGVPIRQKGRRKLIPECIKKWGTRAVDVIKADPFRLTVGRMPGVGFGAADKMYVRLGLPLHRLKRQMLAAHYAVRKKEGDTWLPLAEAFRAIESAIGGTAVQVRRAVKLGVRAGWFRLYLDTDGVCW